ncbi:MAG: TetR/AcrR family transcriptional regulator [Anaerolineales bacterium]
MTPRLKQADREQILQSNRKALLEAAAIEIAHSGYNGANINQISLAAGFAKGTIYNYFPSKQALMLALLDDFAQSHYEKLADAVWVVDDPKERLLNFFDAGFDFIAKNIAPARVVVNTIYGPEEIFKSHLYRAYQPMFELVAAEILVPGIEQGCFRLMDPVATANLLMTMYLGTASQVTDEGTFFMDAAQVIDFALHALERKA